ncbi:hypothetical protein [Kitasatospora mediocidica]|uniref:hypothetical protein n=1 Tax=Kitasatospora mediocidica TaxID=58352 RepID=UPI0012FB2B4F|nr:hypothetical protein [Kitasatospora mediocidica]
MAYYRAEAAKNAQALSVEVETLTVFKGKVDAMLQTLDGSEASHPKISQQQLTAAHLGTGFGESTALLGAYDIVHANLETLSQTLANQIEAMSIAIDISNKGYQNVDDAHRVALWKIQAQTDAQYKTPIGPSRLVAPVSTDVTTTDTSVTTDATPASTTTSTSTATSTSGSTSGTGTGVG